MPTDRLRLIEALSGPVLEHVARMPRAAVLAGQRVPSRASDRPWCPPRDTWVGEPAPGDAVAHRADGLDVATVLEGRCHVLVDPVMYEARAGDWFVFRPLQACGDWLLPGKPSCRQFWFRLHDRGLDLLLVRRSRTHRFAVQGAENLDRPPPEIQAGLQQFAHRPTRRRLSGRRRLVHLVHWCLERLHALQAEARRSPHPAIVQAQELLQTAAGRPPSVAWLAEQVGLSPNYLSRLFHRETGQTIRRLIETRRMELARQQLSDPTRRIKQVAYSLGFADSHHLSHAFRRATGVSPTEYRRRLRAEKDTES